MSPTRASRPPRRLPRKAAGRAGADAGRRPAGRLPAEPAAARATRAIEIVRRLSARYPDVRIPLHHRNPLELLVATILSAQSTDAQVNLVTPALFRRYRRAADFARAPAPELETYIHSTGFYHAKARALQRCARALLERHDGEVPRTMEELVRLPGVGRKTANVVLSGFGVPGIVVDTHVRRLAQRMALTAHDDPDKIEQDLMQLIPSEEWSAFSLRMIFLGRELCSARRPQCPVCPLADVCPSSRYGGAPPWMRPRAPRPARAGTRPDRGAGAVRKGRAR
ncbi:MAG TPA: endonuclease III [bacterium]|nr:endonuclease III [bacterium]